MCSVDIKAELEQGGHTFDLGCVGDPSDLMIRVSEVTFDTSNVYYRKRKHRYRQQCFFKPKITNL